MQPPIGPLARFVFSTLLLLFLALTVTISILFYHIFPFQPFRDIVTLLFALITLYAITLVFCQTVLFFFPYKPGFIEAGSRTEFIFHIVTAFELFIFFPLLSPRVLQPPFTPFIYRLHGATIGKNSYPASALLGPPFRMIAIGDNVIFGSNALLTAHILAAGKVELGPISIGSNVTLDVNSVIFPNVTIGEGAIVAAGAVVAKGTHIPPYEIWGGLPAVKIGTRAIPVIE